MSKIKTTETMELVGINETIAQNDWTEDVSFTLKPEDVDGKILAFTMVSRLDDATGGTGTILLPSGTLAVFSADPALTAADAALASGVADTILGTVAVATGDWVSQTLGAWVNKLKVDIPFFPLKTLYFAFFWTLATSINSASGDDEILEIDVQIETNEIV